jgi:hypothetical protein
MNDSKQSIASRIQACPSRDAMAREALSILIDATGASGGHLFCLSKGRLLPVASSEPARKPRELQLALEHMLKREYGGDLVTTIYDASNMTPAAIQPLEQQDGEPLVLLGNHGGDTVVAGVAVLRYPDGARSALHRRTLDELTRALVAVKLADPVVCAS